MPNIKSAKKRVIVNEQRRAINKAYKSELATGLKKYKVAVASGDVEAVKALLPVTVSLIDESVTRGIIHKNKADRKKADVNSKFNALVKAQPAKKTATKAVKEEKKEEVKVEAPVVEEAKAKKAPAKKAAASKTTSKKATAETNEEKPAVKKAPAKKAAASKTTSKKAE